jgi:hypothetical protein
MRPNPSGDERYAQARLRLLDLAEDASLYLRRSAEPSVRVAAALLLAASLAACSSRSSTGAGPDIDVPAIPPLSQEVREGLPAVPGTYPVSPSSITRDAQGVYGLTWRNPTGAAPWIQGRASLMKLAQGTDDTLEIPQSGDPILRLKPDTPITLPDDDAPIGGPTPTPRASTSSSSSSSGSSFGNRSIAWYPFATGGGTTTSAGTGSTGTGSTGSSESVAATTPAYRNPPAAEPGQGSVRGSSSSLSAPNTSARTWTSPSRAASTGQAGGPGRGTAASSRAGSLSGPASGAARPSSAGFSGGRSGASSSSSSSGG